MHYSAAVLCALRFEADPIIQRFELKEIEGFFDERLGLRLFAKEDSHQFCLVLFGKCKRNNVDRIGTQIASIAAWETIRLIKPNMIISAGTAGGFKARGANIGDVFLSDKHIFFHGRHIPVPKYQTFAKGEFPVFSDINLSDTTRLKRGIVSSGDSVPTNLLDSQLMAEIGTDAKDMEAAAIAEIAQITGTKVIALKCISDFVDIGTETHVQVRENFRLALSNLTDCLEEVITLNIG